MAQIRRKTGFDGAQIFRKFMWFLLRERKFDSSAVDDCVLLKSAFGLTEQEVCRLLLYGRRSMHGTCSAAVAGVAGAVSCIHVQGTTQRMQVAGALHERAQRIYERYGNVMLEVKGMTKAGIDRKATCRALFSKLLYLQGARCRAAYS